MSVSSYTCSAVTISSSSPRWCLAPPGVRAGGYKGYGLGMMVEVFCGILSGAQYSKHVRTWKVTDRVANLVRYTALARLHFSCVVVVVGVTPDTALPRVLGNQSTSQSVEQLSGKLNYSQTYTYRDSFDYRSMSCLSVSFFLCIFMYFLLSYFCSKLFDVLLACLHYFNQKNA